MFVPDDKTTQSGRITDELREYAKGLFNTRETVLAIADRIDAEHEAMLVDARKTVYEGYVELPKDADGEPIHMGDLVTVPWKDKVYEVAGFSCTKQLCSGIRTIWIDVYSPEKQRNVPLCGADSCRHYHAPTVEDVLREFADEVQRCCDTADTIAEYAAKLRLREGDES